MRNEVVKLKGKKVKFNIHREALELHEIIPELPPDNEVIKIISYGRLSSIAFIKYVAEHTKIKSLYASSLRIGKKHIAILDQLHKRGQLEKATFVVGSVMKNDSKIGKSYQYYQTLLGVAQKNDWQIVVKNNHSKIFLFDTDSGKFVLETSSNLNDCPNIEQFSFEKSDELYGLYLPVFEEFLREQEEKENTSILEE